MEKRTIGVRCMGDQRSAQAALEGGQGPVEVHGQGGAVKLQRIERRAQRGQVGQIRAGQGQIEQRPGHLRVGHELTDNRFHLRALDGVQVGRNFLQHAPRGGLVAAAQGLLLRRALDERLEAGPARLQQVIDQRGGQIGEKVPRRDHFSSL